MTTALEQLDRILKETRKRYKKLVQTDVDYFAEAFETMQQAKIERTELQKSRDQYMKAYWTVLRALQNSYLQYERLIQKTEERKQQELLGENDFLDGKISAYNDARKVIEKRAKEFGINLELKH